MYRVQSITYFPPHAPYRIQKRFRHRTDRERTKKSCSQFFYDRSEGKILGRTLQGWGQLLVFYICFYAVLALICYICWYGFLPSMSTVIPTVLTKQPGFGVYPIISPDFHIQYDANQPPEIDKYVKKVDELLSKFGQVDPAYFPGCTKAENYGFEAGTPCIFLKVNHVIGFKVDPYENVYQLPSKAPDQLRTVVSGLPAEEQKGQVWVSCTSNLDKQPTFTYTPKQSVPAALLQVEKMVMNGDSFYKPEYYQRIIAVKISDLPFGQKFNVKCFLWAKNIEQDEEGAPGVGAVKFSLNVQK